MQGGGGRWPWLCFAAACLSAALLAPRASGDATQDRRVETGLRIFRALLAADIDLDRKTLPDGRLLVVFLCTDDRRRAEELAGLLSRGEHSSSPEPIRGHPLLVETTTDVTLREYEKRRPVAIFLVQPPDDAALHEVIRYGIAEHVIVYSPFEGHVESGVLGGLAIGAQVRPYVNGATLARSGITLKEFFLKVAKVYR